MFRWQLSDDATPISKARGGGYVAFWPASEVGGRLVQVRRAECPA